MNSNVLIIKEPQDIPAQLDRTLIEHYLNTRYWTELPRLDDRGAEIRIGQNPLILNRQLDDLGARTYAFITAWNPQSIRQDDWWNRMHNYRLELELHPHCRLLRRGLGIGQDTDWPAEESFLALDIPLEKAVDIARMFGQYAIVGWEKGGEPVLIVLSRES
ncbi:MAG: DUF3293 domain-containing protein [Bacteroidetes bacterium]|nr:DUF3293 domain-containing protein [Bacteroidota bacterium]